MTTPRKHAQTQGFTLIEMLIGVALMALIFVGLVALMGRSAQASRTAVVAASSNASMTKTADQFGQDLESGMNILAGASKTQLNFLRLGLATNFVMPPWESIVDQSNDDDNGNFTEDKKTLSAYGPPLTSLVGRDVVVVDPTGNYIVTKVVSSVANAPRPGDSAATAKTTFTCMMSMVGPYKIYPYDSLNYVVNGNGLTRVKNGTETVLAPGISKASFSSLFVNKGEVPFTDAVTVPTLHYENAPFVGLNYTLNSTGEHPTTGWGTARVALAGVFQKGCNDAVKVPYNNTGKLQVNVLYNGQPTAPAAGLVPNVSVNGVTPISNITTWDTIVYDKLRAGTYSVAAPDITQGSTIYRATLVNNPGTVGNGRGASINVNYEKVKGKVSIQVTGLPAGTPSNAGTVTISGPDPMTIPAINGTTPLQLTPGNYSFSATTVNGYVPTISTTTMTVNSTTNTTVTVSYALPTGPLSIGVQGLPAGNSAPISVSGPQSQTANITTGTTQTLSLQTGTYTVSAPDVTVGGAVYTADKPSQSVGLNTSGASVSVTYKNKFPETPPPPPASGTTFKLRTGGLPSDASLTLKSFNLVGGSLQAAASTPLQGNMIYTLDASKYYSLVFDSTTDSDSGGACTEDDGHGGRTECDTGNGQNRRGRDNRILHLSWYVNASDNQGQNAEDNMNGSIKYKANTETDFVTFGCSAKNYSGVKYGDTVAFYRSQANCKEYNPVTLSDNDVNVVMTAVKKVLADNYGSIVNRFNNPTGYAQSIYIKDLFTASNLTPDQQRLWDNTYIGLGVTANEDGVEGAPLTVPTIFTYCDAFMVTNCNNPEITNFQVKQ